MYFVSIVPIPVSPRETALLLRGDTRAGTMETKYSARNEASLTKILHPLPVLQHLFTNESHLHRRTNRKTILNDGHRIFYRPVAVPTILFLLGESNSKKRIVGTARIVGDSFLRGAGDERPLALQGGRGRSRSENCHKKVVRRW